MSDNRDDFLPESKSDQEKEMRQDLSNYLTGLVEDLVADYPTEEMVSNLFDEFGNLDWLATRKALTEFLADKDRK